MNSLLELNFTKDKSSKQRANGFDSEFLRREYYIKHLTISALERESACVDTTNSLMKTPAFYTMTGIFDFYVNNNAFDLILLKPDSDELVFPVVQSEIRSNLYGYVVARLNDDLNGAEVLGYFLSKDLEKAVFVERYTGLELKSISEFENIEILDSQMTLDDVSESFFALMSNFMDDNLGNEALAELTCLLFNSSELRDVFADITKFENICIPLKDNQELITDEFLSVFSSNEGSEDEEEAELEEEERLNTETFSLDDLALTEDDTENEISEETSTEINQESASIEEPEEDTFLIEETDELVLEESSEFETLSDLDELEEGDTEEPLTSVTDEETEQEISLEEEFTTFEELDELPSEEDATEDLFNITEDEELTIVEELESPSEPQHEPEEETQPLLSSAIETDEMELKLEELDLEELTEFESANMEQGADTETTFSTEPEVNDLTKTVDFELESLAEQTEAGEELEFLEFQVLDDKGADTTQSQQTIEFEDINEEQAQYVNLLSTNLNPNISGLEPELQKILAKVSDEEPIVVDDNELLSILGVNTQQNSGENTNNNDLKLLYSTDETAKTVEFPGESIVSSAKHSAGKTKNKNALVLISLVAVLAVIGVAVSKFSAQKESPVVNDFTPPAPPINMPDSLPPVNTNMAATIPQQSQNIAPKKEVVMPEANDTKIVSSINKDIKAGAAPVILRSVAWQVPSAISSDAVFNKYLQIAGKNIKMNLASDLLNTSDFAYNNKIKVSMTVRNNAPVTNVKIVESSGSQNVDDIVLQSIKQTLKYINSPVMSTDKGDKDVVLVISI